MAVAHDPRASEPLRDAVERMAAIFPVMSVCTLQSCLFYV